MSKNEKKIRTSISNIYRLNMHLLCTTHIFNLYLALIFKDLLCTFIYLFNLYFFLLTYVSNFPLLNLNIQLFFIYLITSYLSVKYTPIFLPSNLSYLSICLSIVLAIYVCIYIYISRYLLKTLSLHLFISLSIYFLILY